VAGGDGVVAQPLKNIRLINAKQMRTIRVCIKIWPLSFFKVLISMFKKAPLFAALALAAMATFGTANAQDQQLNLYSARHYQTDEALYSNGRDFAGRCGAPGQGRCRWPVLADQVCGA
jgi:hypothetical protein